MSESEPNNIWNILLGSLEPSLHRKCLNKKIYLQYNKIRIEMDVFIWILTMQLVSRENNNLKGFSLNRR